MTAPVRQRPVTIGPLRAFEAVARLLNFRAAGEELHLTQSAVSRQIQGLEEDVGALLFVRGTRQVSLTAQGAVLLRAVGPLLERLDGAVRQIRAAHARPRVSITTFASFATLWLIPRLEAFQRAHPNLDIRISASDAMLDMDDPDIDLALRFCTPERAPAGAERLFGEVIAPMVSRWLVDRMQRGEVAPLRVPADLARHTLLEDEVPLVAMTQPGTDLTWRGWLARRQLAGLEPASWMTFNYTHQQVQAAQAGQGITLGRMPLVADLLARGDMIELFGAAGRDALRTTYWLITAPAAADRPEVAELRRWILAQAAQMRQMIGEDRSTDTAAGLSPPA